MIWKAETLCALSLAASRITRAWRRWPPMTVNSATFWSFLISVQSSRATRLSS